VLNGSPGYINLLDALNSWQLVRELKAATGLPAATSFKHVSPAGAALGLPLGDDLAAACRVKNAELSPLAMAYARARGADRLCSFGDWVALSDTVDLPTAKQLAREVSDGMIAPGYEPEALEVLKKKSGGRYTILQIDESFEPDPQETRDVFGVQLIQGRSTATIDEALLSEIVTQNKTLTAEAKRDLVVAMIVLKYTQSNSVVYVKDGQAIGVGAGQQSRVHCTRLAGDKADNWWLRQHPRTLSLPFKPEAKRVDRDNGVDGFLREDITPAEEQAWLELFTETPARLTKAERREWLNNLTDVALGSDAFFPFRDNVDRAAASGVKYIAQPGGSVRDEGVVSAADGYGMVMALTHLRLFHH
jgi:AICAR transformylase/IMP cyclohydrolase PurH